MAARTRTGDVGGMRNACRRDFDAAFRARTLNVMSVATRGAEDGDRSIRRRVVGCLSFLMVLAAIPLGWFGAFLFWQSRSSTGGGPMGGLSAFSMIAGVSVMGLAAVALVVGAIFYIRSGKD